MSEDSVDPDDHQMLFTAVQQRRTVVEVLGVSLGPTVDLGRVDYNLKMFKDGDGTVTVGGTGSQTAHVSSSDTL